MKSFYVHNGSVRLHVLEKGKASKGGTSLLIVGGIWESAERAIPLLNGLSGHVVAFSFRGRGLSSTPETGYTLADHLSDINTVVKHCGLHEYWMLGFSRGGGYALAWSLENQRQMKGLIVVDQPPIHGSLSASKVAFWSNLVYQGVPITDFMRIRAIEGLGEEAEEVSFLSRLPELDIPVTIFVGRSKDSEIGSDVTDIMLDEYIRSISSCKIVIFHHSGHMIPDEEREKYIEELQLVLNN